MSALTLDEVRQRQDLWCDGLRDLSKRMFAGNLSKKQQRALAEAFVKKHYTRHMVFKPTLAVAPNTVRTNVAGASSYFVGGDPRYGDEGFAKKKKWRGCIMGRENVAQISPQAMVISQPVTFEYEEDDGRLSSQTVDKTWTFVRTQDGDGSILPKILQHHSSLQIQK